MSEDIASGYGTKWANLSLIVDKLYSLKEEPSRDVVLCKGDD